ncbi:MAG: hypothetical protein IT158_17655, partial [Bryobacterales bacterium]|nr:hypothetical protein [Bryobacterales bacterium]
KLSRRDFAPLLQVGIVHQPVAPENTRLRGTGGRGLQYPSGQRELNLPRFEAVKRRLAEFVGSLGGYRRNRYEDLPETVREKIADAWGRSFQAWDYAV